MSLEKKAEALLQATTDLVNSVSALLGEGKQPVKTEKPKETKKPNKPAENTAALKKEVKLKAAEVQENCGKDKLAKLLGEFGVTKLSELKPGANVYPDFINRAKDLIDLEQARIDSGEKEISDLLDDEPPAEATTLTMDDVKAKMQEILEHPDLGTNFLIGILDQFGATRLGELKPSKFQAAIDAANVELKKVAE